MVGQVMVRQLARQELEGALKGRSVPGGRAQSLIPDTIRLVCSESKPTPRLKEMAQSTIAAIVGVHREVKARD